MVTKEIRLDLLNRLVAAARECAEDLQAEVETRYPQSMREDQPAIMRRYIRDMAPALLALELVCRFETEII